MHTRGKKVACVGLVCLDIVQECSSYPTEDSDQRSLSIRWQRGGNACNNCTVLSQIGMKCEFMGSLSSDHELSFIEKDFEDHGICLEHCPKWKSVPGKSFLDSFPVSTVLINCKNGSRTIIHSKGDIPELSLENFKELNLSDYAWIHFEGRNIEAVSSMMDYIKSWREKNRNENPALPVISVELEKPKPGLLSLASHADVVFISKDFAMYHEWNGMQPTIKGMINHVREGAVLICTWGELGSSGLCVHSQTQNSYDEKDLSSEIFHFPAYPPVVVEDTLGAGDTFVAGFIRAFSASTNLSKALQFASKLAGAKQQTCKCPYMKGWRRNTLADVPAILNLNGCKTREIFGDVSMPQLIEKAFFSVSQLDPDNDIISHIALMSYPNISSVPPWDWLHWAKKLYRIAGMDNRNTLFIHHIAWDSKCSLIFLKPLIDILFLNLIKLEYLLMVTPPGVAPSEIFEDYFTKLLPSDSEYSSNVQTVYFCMRERYFPKLIIRMAVEEDHDDLAPIINKQNSKLKLVYGEYFMSDLISHPGDSRKVLVAQGSTVAVGVMSLSTSIDIKNLIQHFELAAFNGLCKPDKEDKIVMKPLQVVSSLKKIDAIIDISSKQLGSVEEEYPQDSFISGILNNKQKIIQGRVSDRMSEEIGSTHDNYKSRRLMSIYTELIVGDTSSLVDKLGDHSDFSRVMPFMRDSERGGLMKLWKPEIVLPNYLGKENAFCIELLAIHDDYDERQAEDFLQAAFEIFPDYEYCLISLPFMCPTFPLIKFFERVSPRCHQTFPHELFIMHRNSALSGITLQHASSLDKDVISFLSTMELNQDIIMDFLGAVTPENSATMAFVIKSEGCVVGLVVIQEEEDIDYVRANYNIDKFSKFELISPEEHGQILQMSLSPIFKRHSRYVMREILRLTGMACLYYKLYPKWLEVKKRQQNIMTAIGEMVPVRPRKPITRHLKSLDDDCRNDEIPKTQDPYALYMINMKSSSRLPLSINTRIVVVGSSEIAISFLETLFFSSTEEFLTLHNVYLVSPHGLPKKSDNSIADTFFLNEKFYNPEYLAKVSLDTWVNSVLGTMTGIKRDEKTVTVDYNTVLRYDYLFITCGEQFHDALEMPPYNTNSPQRKGHMKRSTLINSFCIISHEVTLCLWEYLKKYFKKLSSRKIIVHGHSLEAYVTVAALIESGYGDSILLVEDFSQDSHIITCFNNDEVYQGVMNAMKKEGVEILQGYHLDSWQIEEAENEVISVTLTNKVLYKVFECLVFVNCGKQTVDTTTFLAISQASLVCNKYVVINPDFSTNDPSIYSAGLITRYAGRYYAEEYEHRYYNAREVGKKMCEEIRSIWNPSSSGKIIKKSKDIILGFKKPLVIACKLPSGWNYLHVCKPGKQAPLNEAIQNSNYGRVLLTGNCLSEQGGYFRIHLNPWNIVETITCYTKKSIDFGNIVKLYGKHDRLLNNLVKRYEKGCITDLYEHFSQPWITAIYYDRFSDLHKELLSTFKKILEVEETPLAEMISIIHEGYREEREDIFQSLKILFKPSLARRRIELKILEFLSRNRQHFPMYVQMSDMEETIEQRKDSAFHYPQ